MKRSEYQEIFSKISKMVDGLAVIANERGEVTVSAAGEKTTKLPTPSMVCLMDTLASGEPVGVRVDEGITICVMHLSANRWLVLDNSQTVAKAAQQKKAIINALPFIAQIAGGDATLFNREGIRENAFFPDGSENVAAIGEYQELYSKTLKEMRPSIGPAFFAEGASAVRVPITEEYGLAFNNKQSNQRQKRLLDESRRHQYARYHMEDIIGISAAINKAKSIARNAARTQSTVLVNGETGTGKELFAQAIHNASDRSAQPFIAINCGAIPENLVESILFGYAEGAFTGAKKSGNIGAFEQANSGTLFLDEISEMPFDLQVRLLRAIQEREITRVGESTPVKIDVRIIASTNRDMKVLVEEGGFRPDLYFRLNVLTVDIPSLRERTDDIVPLFDYFLHKFAKMMSKSGFYLEFSPQVLDVLKKYEWPGNVRELQNCAEYAINMLETGDNTIDVRHLPYYILDGEGAVKDGYSSYEEYMYNREHEFLAKAYKECGGNKSKMAKQLGVNRTTLLRMLKKHELG